MEVARTILTATANYPRAATTVRKCYISSGVTTRGMSQRVKDVVIVHGDLLNPSAEILPKNRSVRLVGGYGDVLLRVRKMFVADTPYRLLDNIRTHCTAVLPSPWSAPNEDFQVVGQFGRVEVASRLSAFTEDIVKNTLKHTTTPNTNAGKVHEFRAWRTATAQSDRVDLKVNIRPIVIEESP